LIPWRAAVKVSIYVKESVQWYLKRRRELENLSGEARDG